MSNTSVEEILSTPKKELCISLTDEECPFKAQLEKIISEYEERLKLLGILKNNMRTIAQSADDEVKKALSDFTKIKRPIGDYKPQPLSETLSAGKVIFILWDEVPLLQEKLKIGLNAFKIINEKVVC